MPPLQRSIFLNTLKLFDLLAVALSFIVATIAVHHNLRTVSFDQFLAMRITVQNFFIFFGFLIVWHFIFVLMGFYGSRRLISLRKKIIDTIKVTFSGTLVLSAISILFSIVLVTPVFLAVFFTVSSAIIILSRIIIGYFLKQSRVHGQNLSHMLIVGSNMQAVKFAQKIEKNKALGYHLIGFVDNKWKGIEEFQTTGYHLVTDLNNLADFLSHNIVDEVVICLPIKAYARKVPQILSICQEQGVIVRSHLDVFIPGLMQSKEEKLDDEPVITIYSGTMDDSLRVLTKRMLDIAISLISIIILSPLLLITALIIKLTSSGPVFFTQERVGLNKRRFRLYKFRTMVTDAEQKLSELEHLNEVCGPVFKIKDDPRITRVGKFLRKTSIDELPQLFNVLKGDMSLVGPRPLPVIDYKGFDQDWHRRRLSVQPGITCLWQINGRCSVPFEKWMELDLEYIDRWSLWLDFKILAKTIPAVVNGSGAS
jgi:exopolysaccharide biosynthesis polyprenyl glycosylphosphotransferase